MATQTQTKSNRLAGRTMYIPRMTYVGARMFAAVFRGVGIDSQVTEESDERTLELGGLYSSGEECYPEKVTVGDFLRIVHSPGFDPDKTAFFMPIADGPCRFGQYAPYLKQVLTELGYPDIPIVSPTSKDSYEAVGDHATDMIRTTWRGLVAADILRKLLLKTRPYETVPGAADEAFELSMRKVEKVLEQPGLAAGPRLAGLRAALLECRSLFRDVPARYTRDRMLIGVVGEIFCRLNTFSNYDAIRQIEAHGGEAWLSDVCEWVWYTNWGQKDALRRDRRTWSLEMLKALLRNRIQQSDEHALVGLFAEDFTGYEEPHDIYEQVLRPGWPYLPANSALGEMVLSVGKSIYLYNKGIDGIIDISPFSCMNGIVSEAVYPAVSRDHADLPIRNFYFDSSSSNMERDLDIFMELARAYNRRKSIPRQYPAGFGQS